MKDRTRDPRALNLATLCKDGAALEGSLALTGLPRLAASFAAASDGAALWNAQGSLLPVSGAEPELWLHLQASAQVPLECQRCLSLFVQPLQVDRRIRFVRTEDEAARLDEASENDVMALPTRLDLHELVEDELILALPIVPRHMEDCPQPLLAPGQPRQPEADEHDLAPHPFAALAALRRRTPQV
jgi:uncharacterized protein